MQKLKDELSQSRTAFFEEVRTLHEAYVLSHPAASAGEEGSADAILAALASALGYTHRSCEDIPASG